MCKGNWAFLAQVLNVSVKPSPSWSFLRNGGTLWTFAIILDGYPRDWNTKNRLILPTMIAFYG